MTKYMRIECHFTMVVDISMYSATVVKLIFLIGCKVTLFGALLFSLRLLDNFSR
jgi:hypothetical protein